MGKHGSFPRIQETVRGIADHYHNKLIHREPHWEEDVDGERRMGENDQADE